MNKNNTKILNRNSEHPTSFFRRGQLLIEMMVALGILTVGFLGVTALLSRAISLSRSVSDNYIATYLAEEGIEISKNILDANRQSGLAWNDGFGSVPYAVDSLTEATVNPKDMFLADTDSTLNIDSNNNYTYGPGTPTRFKRRITSSIGFGGQEVIVHSIVSWITLGGGSFSVDLEDRFYNWQSIKP